MNKLLGICLVLSIVSSCNQQEYKVTGNNFPTRQVPIDTLISELSKAKEDTNKATLLIELSMAYSVAQYDEAVRYGKEGLSLSEKLHWKPGMAQSHQQIGLGYLDKSDYPKAKSHLLQALQLNEELENKTGIANVLSSLGEVYGNQAYYSEALEYYFKALKLFEDLSDSNGTALVLGNIGIVYFYLFEPKTLEYLNKALKMNKGLGNKSGMGENLRFLGNVYNHRLNDNSKALEYYSKAMQIEEELGDKARIAQILINIGIVYGNLHDHYKELEYKFQGLHLYEDLGNKGGIANALGNLGWCYYFIGTHPKETLDPRLVQFDVTSKRNALLLSRTYLDKANRLMHQLGELEYESYFVISQIDSSLGHYKDAYANYRKGVAIKDSMFSLDRTTNVAQMQMRYEFDKRDIQVKAEQEKKQIVQTNIRNIIVGVLITAVLALVVVYRQSKRTLKQKKRSDELLLNILPEEVANELKSKGSAEAKQFEEVTVLFTDFKDFTSIAQQMTAKDLVVEIHTCFKAFDEIVEKLGIEKIKTIGDSYMCAGGIPVANKTHAIDVVNAALEIQQFVLNRESENSLAGKESFQIRIGIHTGPVVAGIVGIKKFAYDIWGDTVNTASRMESSGEAGEVNISGTTYELVKEKFICSHRGKIQAKNKGELDMYYVEGRI